jgi:raffinose/stachyose/melibiose transport system substrate-binding protein
MKKAVSIALLTLIAFFIVVFSTFYGIGGTLQPGHGSIAEKTELTFMNSWGGYDAKAEVLDNILTKFQKENPNVTVINQTVSGDDFLPSIKEKFATGEPPDVFGLWPGSDIRSLIKNGKVADITDLINKDPEWKNSFGKDMWPQVEQNGRIYGLPVEMTYEGLFINSNLFEKYDVKVPENYDELVKAIKTFKKNKIIPIAYNSKPEGSYLYQNIAMSLGGKEIENPIKNGKVCDSYIQAMYIMRDLFKMGAFPPANDCFTMDSNTRDDLFLNGKAAMIVQGSWFEGKCTNKAIKLVAFPRMTKVNENRLIYGLGCGTFYISKKAWDNPAKREQAIKLLKVLTSRDSSIELAQKTDMISNVDISGYNIEYNELTQKGLDLIKNSDLLVNPPDSYISRSVWESVIVKNFPDMLNENISPEELWEEAIAAGAEEK